MTAKLYFTELSNQPTVAQLQQLTCLTWDGDLISKTERDKLYKAELIDRFDGGWQIITAKGVQYLQHLGFINA